MNIEKAIEYLKESLCDQKQGESYQEYHNAVLNLAIKALEKQMPKKPDDISKIYTGEKIGTCVCGYDSALEHEKHCHNCGQKLDWEG